MTFSVLPTDSCWTPGVIADAVRHYPVPVTVNGRKAEQSDFLKDAVRTETWRGLRVAVFHSTSSTWATPGINFHGLHVAFPDLPHVHALPGADADAPRTWWTLADVIDCPDIELTLPTRTAIVQTPFTAELVSEATRIIYRAIAAEGRTPRLGYETRTRAAAAGIELPTDPRHLTPWRPRNARKGKPLERPRHPDLQHAVLVDDELDAAEIPNADAYEHAQDPPGRRATLPRGRRRDRARAPGEAGGRDTPIEMRMPASAALLSPEADGTSQPEPVFVTRRDAPIDRDALGHALAEAYFQPSFDSDADSVDTQMREYRRRIAHLVTELLKSPEAAAEADLRELMTTRILPSISGDSNVDIEIRNGAIAAIHRI